MLRPKELLCVAGRHVDDHRAFRASSIIRSKAGGNVHGAESLPDFARRNVEGEDNEGTRVAIGGLVVTVHDVGHFGIDRHPRRRPGPVEAKEVLDVAYVVAAQGSLRGVGVGEVQTELVFRQELGGTRGTPVIIFFVVIGERDAKTHVLPRTPTIRIDGDEDLLDFFKAGIQEVVDNLEYLVDILLGRDVL